MSLHGSFETPEQVRARIGRTGREQDLAIGNAGPNLGNVLAASAGRNLVEGLFGLAGKENPEIVRARGVQEAVQTAQAASGDDLGKFYAELAKGFKKQGMTSESMKALQALQTHNNNQDKIDQANRKIAAQETTAEASALRAETGASESIPGKARLAIMTKNADSAAKKARAALIAAGRATGSRSLSGFKSKPVTVQQVKSVGLQLSNDSVFRRMDSGLLGTGNDSQGTYVGSIAQAAQDIVAIDKSRGKATTFTQARDKAKSIADKYVTNNSMFKDTFDQEGFTAELLQELDNPSSTGGFRIVP